MLREVRYGIHLDWNEVTIAPFGPTSFSYHIGNINVDYSNVSVTVDLPGTGSRRFTVNGVHPLVIWTFTLSGVCAKTAPPGQTMSSEAGQLVFNAAVGTGCVTQAVHTK